MAFLFFSDSDSDSNEGESKKPGFAYAKIRHMGTVNRIRVGILFSLFLFIFFTSYIMKFTNESDVNIYLIVYILK